jgi:hypothetical protein
MDRANTICFLKKSPQRALAKNLTSLRYQRGKTITLEGFSTSFLLPIFLQGEKEKEPSLGFQPVSTIPLGQGVHQGHHGRSLLRSVPTYCNQHSHAES